MYYTFYMEPDASESTFATTTEANPYFAGYILLSVINSIVSLTTVNGVVAYYNERVAQENLQEEKAEISDSQGGETDTTTSADDGIIIF